MNKVCHLVILCLAFTPSVTVGSTRDRTPDQFVRTLYRGYGTSDMPDPLGTIAFRIFAPSLLHLIREDERRAIQQPGLLDGDPICDCQDDGGFRLLRIDTIQSGPDRATSTIRITFGNIPRTIRLDLARIEGRWLVSNTHNEDIPNLLTYLRTGLGR